MAVGPLTNVALALRVAPDLAGRIAGISIMGGGTFGNRSAVAEFNIWADPEAAAVVFEAGVPLVMAGLDLTHQLLATPARIDAVRRQPGRLAAMLADLFAFFSATYIGRHDEIAGAAVHDPCAVLALTHPELFGREERHVAIETTGALTRGMTVIDRRTLMERPAANCGVLTTIDADAAWAVIVDAVALVRLTARPGGGEYGALRHERRPHLSDRRRRLLSRGSRPARSGTRSASPATSSCPRTAGASCSCAAAAAPTPSTACGSSTPPPARSASSPTPRSSCPAATTRTCRRRSGPAGSGRRESAGGITAFATDAAVTVTSFAIAGRLFVGGLLSGTARELPVAGPVFDPRPDPTARRVAYVNGRLLCIGELDGRWRLLAGDDPDEPETVTWGSADFIAAEEMHRFRGYWWSPDGDALAVDPGRHAAGAALVPRRPRRPRRAAPRAARTRRRARPTPT